MGAPLNQSSPKFRREPAEARKLALIQATLDLVARDGVSAATVRAIALKAKVTQGLIRHYFSTKEELISAAYEYHMTEMTDQVTAAVGTGPATDQLSRFIDAALRPPAANPRAVALWAGFFSKVQNDPEMKAIHARTYTYFRDNLERLIAAALEENDRPSSPERLHRLAIAANALIDGLWLEGSALPEAFEAEELPQIGRDAIGAMIGISLSVKATT